MNKKFWTELWFYLLYAFIGFVVVLLLSYAISALLAEDGIHQPMPEYLHLVQWSQTLFLMFLPPLLWFHIRFRMPVWHVFGISRPSMSFMLLTTFLMLSMLPFMETVVAWNEQLPLPDALAQWAHNARTTNEQILGLILAADGWQGWTSQIALICIGTALAEEVMFRAGLLQLFRYTTLNKHVVAILIGLVFSLIHFDLLGLVPRWLLGTLFVYLVYWSGSLWPAVWAHVLNNLFALLAHKLPSVTAMLEHIQTPVYTLLSLVSVVGLLYAMYAAPDRKRSL